MYSSKVEAHAVDVPSREAWAMAGHLEIAEGSTPGQRAGSLGSTEILGTMQGTTPILPSSRGESLMIQEGMDAPPSYNEEGAGGTASARKQTMKPDSRSSRIGSSPLMEKGYTTLPGVVTSDGERRINIIHTLTQYSF
jgi:hypothetical protein